MLISSLLILGVALFAPSPFLKQANAPSPLNLGVWLGEWPMPENRNIEEFETLTGQQHPLVHTFVNSSQDLTHWESVLNYVDSTGGTNLLTLELIDEEGNEYSTADVNEGKLDEQFRKIASQLRDWNDGETIWLRILHEVNSDWYGWSIGDGETNTNESYKQAFRRIVSIFREEGAENIRFIYNVNNENIGASSSFTGAYPGDEYVDYVSIDGYNWGDLHPWSFWRPFQSVFDEAYRAVTSVSDRPVIIAEYGSTELGGDKAAWIRNAVDVMKSDAYPRLIAAVWFNENKETDWRVDSSPEALEAYRSFKQDTAE